MNRKRKKILRQPLSNRFVHWTTAGAIFLLIISGLGQLPLYKRYNIDKLPGGEWLIDYFNTLTLHYIGAIILLFIFAYHIVVHLVRKEYDLLPKRGDIKNSYLLIKSMITKSDPPECEKYLPEQRLAYLFIGGNVLLLIVTGIIKMIKNIPGTNIPNGVILWSAHIHNFATIFLIIGIIAHLAAFLFKENRQMLPGMFTGYVDEEYVEKRHSIWYKQLLKENKRTFHEKDDLSS